MESALNKEMIKGTLWTCSILCYFHSTFNIVSMQMCHGNRCLMFLLQAEACMLSIQHYGIFLRFLSTWLSAFWFSHATLNQIRISRGSTRVLVIFNSWLPRIPHVVEFVVQVPKHKANGTRILQAFCMWTGHKYLLSSSWLEQTGMAASQEKIFKKRESEEWEGHSSEKGQISTAHSVKPNTILMLAKVWEVTDAK